MSDANPGRELHGDQFSPDRFGDTVAIDDGVVPELLRRVWDVRHVITTEPETPYDNFADEKALHQILDYAGCDYVLDRYGQPPVGINHRTHLPPNSDGLRLDLRRATGSSKPGTLDLLIDGHSSLSLLPRFATRLKVDTDGQVEWFRVCRLQTVAAAIDAGLMPSKTWDGSDGTSAWMFDYDLLREMGALEAELAPDMCVDSDDGSSPDAREQIEADPVLTLDDFADRPEVMTDER